MAKNLRMLVIRHQGSMLDAYALHQSRIYTYMMRKIRNTYTLTIPCITRLALICSEKSQWNIFIRSTDYIRKLHQAAVFFELSEEYEKCKKCRELIEEIKQYLKKQPLQIMN